MREANFLITVILIYFYLQFCKFAILLAADKLLHIVLLILPIFVNIHSKCFTIKLGFGLARCARSAIPATFDTTLSVHLTLPTMAVMMERESHCGYARSDRAFKNQPEPVLPTTSCREEGCTVPVRIWGPSERPFVGGVGAAVLQVTSAPGHLPVYVKYARVLTL